MNLDGDNFFADDAELGGDDDDDVNKPEDLIILPRCVKNLLDDLRLLRRSSLSIQ